MKTSPIYTGNIFNQVLGRGFLVRSFTSELNKNFHHLTSLSLYSNKHRFFQVNFLINAAFDPLRMRRLFGGDVYFTFSFPNAAFIGGFVTGRRLKEEIRYLFCFSIIVQKNGIKQISSCVPTLKVSIRSVHTIQFLEPIITQIQRNW